MRASRRIVRRRARFGAAGLALATLALATLGGCAPTRADRPALCRGATDDTLRPIPLALAPAVNAAFHATMPAAMVVRTGVIRCADGAVLACVTGANLNCGPADTSRHNPGAIAWCRGHPDAAFVPLFAAGHASIYAWHCAQGRAVPGRIVQPVDAQGFSAAHWRKIAVPGGSAPPPG
jgi:hypothetical protein